MLLDRIEIDAHGPLQRVELGPFSEHLNVVFAPDGSGKTAISRFVRDALVDRQYPLGMFTSSTGRVVLADRHGMVHCHREKDGTPNGRRRIEFEKRGDFQARYDALENPWLGGISKGSDAGAAIASLEIPEAIVDAVITDASSGSVARVVSACVRSGLDSATTYQSLPLYEDLVYAPHDGRFDTFNEEEYERHRRLRRRLADIDAELARSSTESSDYDSLIARRKQLTARLAQPLPAGRSVSESRRGQLERRSAELQERARGLRSEQSELRRRLADVELDIASCDHSRGAVATQPTHGHYDYAVLCRDRDAIVHQLDRVTASLDACLSEAADVGRRLRSSSGSFGRGRHASDFDPANEIHRQQDALRAELRQVDQRLAVLSRVQWLRNERASLLKQMRVVDHRAVQKSPLAEAASSWLVRLSGGRLHHLDWSGTRFEENYGSYHRDRRTPSGVRIDGRDETVCSVTDRVLASLAVRMAAGDFLAQTGRHVPLVLEIPHDTMLAIERDYDYERSAYAYREQGDQLRSNHPLAAALRDYVQGGRQLLILTSNQELSRQLGRVGARGFQIHTHRIVHPHRPVWRTQYHGETYVGPHPHTYATRDAVDVYPAAHAHWSAVSREDDVNRDLDVAWRESRRFDSPLAETTGAEITGASFHGAPVTGVPDAGVPVAGMSGAASAGFSGFSQKFVGAEVAPRMDEMRADEMRADAMRTDGTRTDWARDGVVYRDGYYFADTYTTQSPESSSQHEPASFDLAKRTKVSAASPFYLTVDSPIDQAPSIDAVAAARLRGLKVTHITHLMQSDPNRLSDALGMASVDAATIRRWQAECRLACRVPNLRGFDARILVGCGVTTPGQLAAMHPTDLLHEVEAFLATERGQQVLLSGTSQELSRIMTWIATANSTSDRNRARSPEARQRAERRRRIIRTMNQRDSLLHTGYPLWDEDGDLDVVSRSTEISSDTISERDRDRAEAIESLAHSERLRRKHLRRSRRKMDVETSEISSEHGSRTLRFYLHRESPIVDAPSIGPRMAERLQGVGIHLVDDLLAADPVSLAADLDHHRVNAETIVRWQHQATLVCRIPMLRGHDAQLLVDAEVTTPEELAQSDAEDLFAIVDKIARSNEGKRILRGGSPPDLQEVRNWIRWAKNQRSLRAA